MKAVASSFPLKQTSAGKVQPLYKPGHASRRGHGLQKKGGHGDGGHGDGTWIFSYADMITILMTFFIMMLSISNVSAEKFDELKEAMKGSSKGSGAAPKEQRLKSVKVNAELAKMAGDKGPQLAGIPLEAVAKKAAETGGDRLAQLSTGVRILLESINKDFIERDLKQMAEFERLKADISKLSQVSESRSAVQARAAEIVILLPTDEVFSEGVLRPEMKAFAQSLVERSKALESRPALRIETHSSRLRSGKLPPLSDESAVTLTAQQGAALLGVFTAAGADPSLVSLAAYGNRKPLVAEKDRYGNPSDVAMRQNNRVLFILERRPLHNERASGKKNSISTEKNP